MKRLFTAIVVLALVGATFNSCKKDDSTISNSVTITGTFTIGDKTYTNPTFNLGDPDLHQGYLTTYYKVPTYNGLRIEDVDGIDLGNNTLLSYNCDIYTVEPGVTTMYCYLEIYPSLAKTTGLYIYSSDAAVTVTKVDAVGGYIEGTYEGDFFLDKKETVPYHLSGKFKVKHTEIPVK